MSRPDGFGGEDVLLVNFCLQVSEAAVGAVNGMVLSGDEHTNDNFYRRSQTATAPLGLTLETAMATVVGDITDLLPEALEHFAARTSSV